MSRWLAVVAVVVAFGPGVRAEDTAKDVLERAVKAHGGAELLAKNKAGLLKAKGKIVVPGLGETDFTQEAAFVLPDKFKESVELAVLGQTITVLTMSNGDAITIEAAGKSVEVTDQVRSALKAGRHMITVGRLIGPARDEGYELSPAGETTIDERPAVGVRVSKKGERDINLFFDKQTHLLAKIEYRAPDQDGNDLKEERFFKDYKKDAGGNMIPGKIVVLHDGKPHLTAAVTECKYLETLPDDVFKK